MLKPQKKMTVKWKEERIKLEEKLNFYLQTYIFS